MVPFAYMDLDAGSLEWTYIDSSMCRLFLCISFTFYPFFGAPATLFIWHYCQITNKIFVFHDTHFMVS